MQSSKSKSKKRKRKSAPALKSAIVRLAAPLAPDSEIPAPDAFLEDAKNEPKRKLISDHIKTINTLREEKRFTFRAIAEWLTKRGIETDHSSVYRAYLGAIPEDRRDPRPERAGIDPSSLDGLERCGHAGLMGASDEGRRTTFQRQTAAQAGSRGQTRLFSKDS